MLDDPKITNEAPSKPTFFQTLVSAVGAAIDAIAAEAVRLCVYVHMHMHTHVYSAGAPAGFQA